MILYPKEIIKGFRIFCIQHEFEHEIIYDFHENSHVSENAAYVVVEENDLVNLIKKCREQQLSIGKDIGIISYNETPLKRIILDGLTTISTDFKALGRQAAELILHRRTEKIEVPFYLTLRKSL